MVQYEEQGMRRMPSKRTASHPSSRKTVFWTLFSNFPSTTFHSGPVKREYESEYIHLSNKFIEQIPHTDKELDIE